MCIYGCVCGRISMYVFAGEYLRLRVREHIYVCVSRRIFICVRVFAGAYLCVHVAFGDSETSIVAAFCFKGLRVFRT